MKLALVILSMLMLSGCTSTRPSYPNTKTESSAKVIGDLPNIVRFFSNGESGIHFVEVDGIYVSQNFVSGHTRELFLNPGKHGLTLQLNGSDYTTAQTEISIEVEAQKTYLFTAQKVGLAFDVTLSLCKPDGTAETTLSQFRVSGRSNPKPTVMPIFIPK
jgi:hypothetical protein